MQRAGSGWYLPFFSDLPSFLLYSLRDPYFLLSYFVLPYFLQVPQPLRQRKEDHRHVSFLRADHGDHPEPESSTHRAIRAGASCILQASLCETWLLYVYGRAHLLFTVQIHFSQYTIVCEWHQLQGIKVVIYTRIYIINVVIYTRIYNYIDSQDRQNFRACKKTGA